MTAYPSWTPASRPGIIPLHPLSFGTILGRSFVALRQNPRVLLGFALVVQTIAYIVVIAAISGVAWASFSRLDTVRPGTDEFEAILAGSVAITAVAGLVLGLCAGALGVIVQGIVVTEVSRAAVAEKLSLGSLWRILRPSVWRLLGWTALVIVAVLVLVAVLAAVLLGIGVAAPPLAIALLIMTVLVAIPLSWWLSTKLLLVPSAIILEGAPVFVAVRRSWQLTRGRFWVALGVILVIGIIFNVVAQVISVPFSFASMGFTTVLAPTGDPDVGAIIGLIVTVLLTQVVTLLLQAVAIVVTSTATALVYIDCRMRHEGLDLDLLSYVERRDAGGAGLPDPYREGIGRPAAARPFGGAYGAYPAGAYPAGAYAAAPYPAQQYPAQQYPAQYQAPQHPAYAGAPGQPPYPAAQPPYAAAGAPPASPQPTATAPAAPTAPPPAGYHVVPPPLTAQPPAAPAPSPTAPAPAPAAPSPTEPAPTQWAAPGSSSDDASRESPWS